MIAPLCTDITELYLGESFTHIRNRSAHKVRKHLFVLENVVSPTAHLRLTIYSLARELLTEQTFPLLTPVQEIQEFCRQYGNKKAEVHTQNWILDTSDDMDALF